jgi:hypothetical protein
VPPSRLGGTRLRLHYIGASLGISGIAALPRRR